MKKLHTHYDNLKIARDAPPEVIKAAYKALCHKFHPDRNGGSLRATQTFQLINTAYEVLSDPDRRQQHDAWIARAEAADFRAKTAPQIGAPHRWNGKERRRRAWTPPGGPAVADLGGRLRRPGAVLVLWASALVGTVAYLLYSS
jgi:curved DNA-binding protein CbpA